MPAGSVEAFHAAIEGGADAVYLGLREFNARGRAHNFSPHQLSVIIKKARQARKKVYVTLNTLIKNRELPQLLETLHLLEKLEPDAVIIQDWGVYYLIKTHFPTLTVHASTQMGNHNSAGAVFSGKKQIERIILARELTMDELQQISKKSQVELELFIHGALCYSFSGMCLFSSFLGGQSANRGLCKQPCRRAYISDKNQDYFFNLKDNQQLNQLESLAKAGITSLKVEGRLKSAEYVHRVAMAYRMVLDDPGKKKEAEKLLSMDLGREKTGYFLSGNVKSAISKDTYTGMLLGEIKNITAGKITFSSPVEIKTANRLRVKPKTASEGKAFKVQHVTVENDLYHVKGLIPKDAQPGDQIYLTDLRQEKFPSKIDTSDATLPQKIPGSIKKNILNSLGKRKNARGKEKILVRIDSLAWLKKIFLPNTDGLILNLTRKQWQELRPEAKFLQKNLEKIIIELPKFIPEKNMDFYADLILRLKNQGYNRFSISHLSQKEFFDGSEKLMTNENVYALNDASVNQIKSEGIQDFIYPLENELDNLKHYADKTGTVPLYFYPALFYSRMPVKADNFTSDKNEIFNRCIIDGITIVYPEIPVSLTQYVDKLRKEGFSSFLVDLSFDKPSGNRYETIIKRLRKSAQIQPSSNFNFVKGLE